MSASPAGTRPTYAVESVDNALRLLQMLRDLGQVRIKRAADELGVSPSTVHRLMSMLVYRGFAVQDESRAYLPEPSIGVRPADAEAAHVLREFVRPHLVELSERARQRAQFMVLTGRMVRVLSTSRLSASVSAGQRQEFLIPAHTSAGGRAILSTLRVEELREIYHGPDWRDGVELLPAAVDALCEDVQTVRARGYSVSERTDEEGMVAVAAPIRHSWVRARSAISVSAPLSRKGTVSDRGSIKLLLAARDAIEIDLLGAEVEDEPSPPTAQSADA